MRPQKLVTSAFRMRLGVGKCGRDFDILPTVIAIGTVADFRDGFVTSMSPQRAGTFACESVSPRARHIKTRLLKDQKRGRERTPQGGTRCPCNSYTFKPLRVSPLGR